MCSLQSNLSLLDMLDEIIMIEERIRSWKKDLEFIPFKETPNTKNEVNAEHKWQYREAEVLVGKNGITPEKRRKVRDVLSSLYKQIITSNSLLAYDIARDVELELFKEKTETYYMDKFNKKRFELKLLIQYSQKIQ